MTLVTLVTGATAARRESAIALAMAPGIPTALILEGLPDGSSSLDPIVESPHVHIARIAPGCLCCTGNLTLRVTLNRLLRQSPRRLYIGLANATHLERLRVLLQQSPYDAWLTLAKDLHA